MKLLSYFNPNNANKFSVFITNQKSKYQQFKITFSDNVIHKKRYHL